MNNLVVFSDIAYVFDEVLVVHQIEIGKKNLPEFQNKFRKFLFFSYREGIFETLKKYKSLQWYNQHLERFATFLLVRIDEDLYVSCSIQSQKDSSKFIVDTKFYAIENKEQYFQIINSKEFQNYSFLDYFNQYDDFNKPFRALNTFIEVPKVYKGIETGGDSNGLFIFGLGGYAFTHILPGLKDLPRVACIDYKSDRAEEFAEKFKFQNAFFHPFQTKHLIANTPNPVVVIATFHSDHAYLAKWVYDINPNAYIFIEKPPTVTEVDFKYLKAIYDNKGSLEIGFNRRYVVLNQNVKELVRDKTIFVTFSIKEVIINPNHWYNWNNQGTRLTGNLVHWIDLGNYWVDSNPTVIVMNFSRESLDDFSLSISYENGSIVNITCSDKGNSLRGVQELVELRFDKETILIQDNLIVSHIDSNGKKNIKKYLKRDKGHAKMYKVFRKNLNEKSFNYSLKDLERTSKITTMATKMLTEKLHVLKIES